MDLNSKKSNKIRDIVRLQQILKKWRKLANSSKAANKITGTAAGPAGKSIKFLKRTLSSAGGESCGGAVPKGYLAVSVGEEQKRFVIPTSYLGHPAFEILLREAEEEFGFQQTGVLRLPCEVFVFENVVKLVEEKKKGDLLLGGEEVLNFCSLETLQLTPSSHRPQSPISNV
ncbi:auxin-responsive protein SAUR72 [Cucumis melo var. makuwa]|uniref:Auxin-responsive protein SAUR72 n=1 Tax=Cucumis melo var. makuwa TaxID=1194695 RepID=A0A5A7TBK3_CUCMM|nr:auxin-responsive protein SAUR72 [Cucumis melo var. makuwa]